MNFNEYRKISAARALIAETADSIREEEEDTTQLIEQLDKAWGACTQAMSNALRLYPSLELEINAKLQES